MVVAAAPGTAPSVPNSGLSGVSSPATAGATQTPSETSTPALVSVSVGHPHRPETRDEIDSRRRREADVANGGGEAAACSAEAAVHSSSAGGGGGGGVVRQISEKKRKLIGDEFYGGDDDDDDVGKRRPDIEHEAIVTVTGVVSGGPVLQSPTPPRGHTPEAATSGSGCVAAASTTAAAAIFGDLNGQQEQEGKHTSGTSLPLHLILPSPPVFFRGSVDRKFVVSTSSFYSPVPPTVL